MTEKNIQCQYLGSTCKYIHVYTEMGTFMNTFTTLKKKSRSPYFKVILLIQLSYASFM